MGDPSTHDPDTTLKVVRAFDSPPVATLAAQALEEAGIPCRLDGEEAATALWYVGSALGGVRLLVHEEHLEKAAKTLDKWEQQRAIERARSAAKGEGETGADDDEDDDELPGIHSELTRAWRASVIGILLLPPVLHVYAVYLLVRHGFFVDEQGSANWRVYATLLFCLGGFLLGYYLFVAPWFGEV